MPIKMLSLKTLQSEAEVISGIFENQRIKSERERKRLFNICHIKIYF